MLNKAEHKPGANSALVCVARVHHSEGLGMARSSCRSKNDTKVEDACVNYKGLCVFVFQGSDGEY